MKDHKPSRRVRFVCGTYWGHIAASILIIIAALFLLAAITRAEELPRTMYVNTQTDPLNVREMPNIHSEKVARLERGEAVTVIRVKSGWALIEGVSEAGQGWASLKYLADEPIEPPELPERFLEVESD